MNDPDLFFVVPTYRLRDVGETIKQYDEHFWRNGQSVRLLVLDDSSPANHEKYYPLLEQTRTHNDLSMSARKKRRISSHSSMSG
jgi:hypothetical protein